VAAVPSHPRATVFPIAVVGWLLAVASAAHGWQVRLTGTGPGNGDALAVAIAPNGDVVAAGYLDGADGQDFAVVRLAAADGTERWRVVLRGGAAVAVAIDPAGDVVAAGTTARFGSRFTVVKIRGVTGAVQWRYDDPVSANAIAVAVDGAGDVYTAGDRALVVKLDRDWGVPLWAVREDGARPTALALFPTGDVAVGAVVPGLDLHTEGAVVRRFDTGTGMEVWSAFLGGGYVTYPFVVSHLAVSPGGDVFAATDEGAVDPHATALRLSNVSGAVLWKHDVGTGFADGIAIMGDGDLAVVKRDFLSSAIFVSNGLHALVLARADGAVVAEHVIPGDVGAAPRGVETGRIRPSRTPEGPPTCPCSAFGKADVVVAPSGDIVTTAQSPFFAARLAPPDLHEVWQRDDTGIGTFDEHAPLRLSGDRVVAGGNVLEAGVNVFSVVTLDVANGASRACGDGTLDDGEVCDDGNRADGDCCTSDCQSAAPDGTSCTDGNACTIGDRCDAGSCVPTGPLPCAPCGECNPEYGCFAAFDHAACARPTTTSAATLVVRRREDLARLDWTLESGPATARDDFGHPRATTGYALCGIADDRRVVLRATAPGGACGRRRCWQRTRRGFEYDNPRAPGGLSHLSLHSGPAGRTRFHARGAGKALVIPDLPVPGALTLELRRIDEPAMCWAAVHGVVIKNAVHRYRATGG